MKFEWNALRIGDHVVVHVHDGVDIESPLLAGRVHMMETTRSRGDANGLGIRVVTAGGGHRVLWPSYLAAHLVPLDPAEDCSRCAGLREPRVA